MADIQRSIFDIIMDPFRTPVYDWELFVDGASRGNPGPAGAGIYLCKGGKEFFGKGFYLQEKTNNQAEYLALLLGIFFLKREFEPGQKVRIVSDSELLIKQMQGLYQVKKPELKVLNRIAQQELSLLNPIFEHVMRENNKQADVFANEGIDKKQSLPLKFLDILRAHDVYL